MRRSDIDKAVYEGWKVRDVENRREGIVERRMNDVRLLVTSDTGKSFTAHFGKLQPLGQSTRRF